MQNAWVLLKYSSFKILFHAKCMGFAEVQFVSNCCNVVHIKQCSDILYMLYISLCLMKSYIFRKIQTSGSITIF